MLHFVSRFSADRQLWLLLVTCTHLRRNLVQLLREIKRIAAFILHHLNANHTLQVHLQATPFSFFGSFIKIFFRAVVCSQLLTHTHTHTGSLTRFCLARARVLSHELANMCVCVCVRVFVLRAVGMFVLLLFSGLMRQTAKGNLNVFFSRWR